MAFVLRPGPGITWWKSLKVAIKGGGFEEIEISDDGQSNAKVIDLATVDTSRPVILSKAKFLGIHTEIRNWRVLPGLVSGAKVTLTWMRDDGCAGGEGIAYPADW